MARLPPATSVRLEFDTDFFVRLGSDVDVVDEGAQDEEGSDGNGANVTLSNNIKDTG